MVEDYGKECETLDLEEPRGNAMIRITGTSILTRLKQQNYDGYLAIEHFDAGNQAESMKNRLRSCLAPKRAIRRSFYNNRKRF